MRKAQKPIVPESNDGRSTAGWTVAVLVVVSAILAARGYAMAATAVMAVTAMALAVMRLVLRERSPWKVRSVACDFLVGMGLGAGLLGTFFSILVML